LPLTANIAIRNVKLNFSNKITSYLKYWGNLDFNLLLGHLLLKIITLFMTNKKNGKRFGSKNSQCDYLEEEFGFIFWVA